MKIMNIMGIAAAVVCFCGSELSAWERTAMNNCKKELKNCKKTSDACKADNDACKKSAEKKDMASFESSLSPYAKSIFVKYSMDQKRQAMDFADGKRVSPDDAVAKVAGNCNCSKK